MTLEHAEHQFRQLGDLDSADQIARMIPIFQDRHPGMKDIALPVDPEFEWLRQSVRYIEHGFHRELGMTAEDYLFSLPKFESASQDFKDYFSLPLIVDTRISVHRQAELLGVRDLASDKGIYDWPHDSESYQTPSQPYAVWMRLPSAVYDGGRNPRKNLKPNERGATVQDCLALYNAKPNILEDFSNLLFVGSSSESRPYEIYDFAPSLMKIAHNTPVFLMFKDEGDYEGPRRADSMAYYPTCSREIA